MSWPCDAVQEKGDGFDAMIESEQRIRLGEEGWKERYYQVRVYSCNRPHHLLVDSSLLSFRLWSCGLCICVGMC